MMHTHSQICTCIYGCVCMSVPSKLCHLPLNVVTFLAAPATPALLPTNVFTTETACFLLPPIYYAVHSWKAVTSSRSSSRFNICLVGKATGCPRKWVRYASLAKYNRILINACWRLFNVRRMPLHIYYSNKKA